MDKEMKFEEAMTALEEITDALESGTLTLDESIAAYERAVKLVKLCNERLSAVEAKVKILTENENGEITATDFITKNAD